MGPARPTWVWTATHEDGSVHIIGAPDLGSQAATHDRGSRVLGLLLARLDQQVPAWSQPVRCCCGDSVLDLGPVGSPSSVMRGS